MKVQITGASNFVNRMFEACGRFQWAREFLKNSIEAGASRVEFGIEWQAVRNAGVYRRTIMDDGCGMTRDELLRFFSTLGEGGKKIGGVHDNFGVGAKIAALPWNPEGVVVISYKNGKGSMIWIVLDSESGDYELVEFEAEDGTRCVIDPALVEHDECEWDRIRPDWLADHGTIVVLLGSTEHPDTVLGNPDGGESDIKGLSTYLNTRFWDLQPLDVRVTELRTPKKNQWPEGPDDRDDSRRPNNRRVLGAQYFLTKVAAADGKLAASDVLLVDEERVVAEWYLWEGERPAVHSYAKKGGYVAVRYKGELFELTSNKLHFRWFGVIESTVQQNLTIILEPQLYEAGAGARWGVHPDQSRNRLIFSGGGERGVAVPLSDWGLEFAENMPEAIRDAIRAARGNGTGSIEDEEYRKRLQDLFGDRWTMKARVEARDPSRRTEQGTATDDDAKTAVDPKGERRGIKPRRKRARKAARRKAAPGGTGRSEEREIPVSVPKYRLVGKDNFEQPWHLALWAPTDLDGPTVLINTESPILAEAVAYHQDQYPDVYAEEVAETVRKTFGEIAVAKVAHSQKLTREISVEVLDAEYRDEKSLTIALMGLLAEESLIAQRLVRFGRRRAVA